MTDEIVAVGGVIAAILTALGAGGWLQKWTDRRALERKADEQRDEKFIGILQSTVARSQRREMLLMQYASQCVAHINEGKPPPAPAWPQELLYDLGRRQSDGDLGDAPA